MLACLHRRGSLPLHLQIQVDKQAAGGYATNPTTGVIQALNSASLQAAASAPNPLLGLKNSLVTILLYCLDLRFGMAHVG